MGRDMKERLSLDLKRDPGGADRRLPQEGVRIGPHRAN